MRLCTNAASQDLPPHALQASKSLLYFKKKRLDLSSSRFDVVWKQKEHVILPQSTLTNKNKNYVHYPCKKLCTFYPHHSRLRSLQIGGHMQAPMQALVVPRSATLSQQNAFNELHARAHANALSECRALPREESANVRCEASSKIPGFSQCVKRRVKRTGAPPKPEDMWSAALLERLSDASLRRFVANRLIAAQSVEGGVPAILGEEQTLEDVCGVEKTQDLSSMILDLATYENWAATLREIRFRQLHLLVVALVPAHPGEGLIESPKLVKMLKAILDLIDKLSNHLLDDDTLSGLPSRREEQTRAVRYMYAVLEVVTRTVRDKEVAWMQKQARKEAEVLQWQRRIHAWIRDTVLPPDVALQRGWEHIKRGTHSAPSSSARIGAEAFNAPRGAGPP